MAKVLGTGYVTLVDLNDAIASPVKPSNPVLGTLWIDTSVEPNRLMSWNGSDWIEQTLSIEALDPKFNDMIEDMRTIVNNASSDGFLSSSEKLNVKLLLVEITGDTLTGSLLPTIAAMDAVRGGQIYMIRAEARASGIPTNHVDYTGFESAYNNLKSYLDGLTPRPWQSGDTAIDPEIWTAKWDDYYEALTKLQVTISTYLANSVKPGKSYNGVVIDEDNGVVVTRGDNLFRTNLNATEGVSIEKNDAGSWGKVFYTNTDGKIYALGLVISSDSTIGGTNAGALVTNVSDMTSIVSSGAAEVINKNPLFYNWSSKLPDGYANEMGTGFSKTVSSNGGNALRFTINDTGNSYISPNAILDKPFYEYITIEVTFKLISGSLNGSGVLLRYWATNDIDHKIKFSSLVPSPVLNKMYTVSTTIRQPSQPAGFKGYLVYPIGGYSGLEPVTSKDIVFEQLKARPSTEQEIQIYEVTTIEEGKTVIDGGKIKTNSVTANKVNARGLIVVSDQGVKTLEVTEQGEVTVNGTVHINSKSVFAEGYDPSQNPGVRNILLNSRFATEDITGWTTWNSPSELVVEDITDLPGFNKAVKITTTAANQGLQQSVRVVSGQKYTFSTYVKSAIGQPVIQVANGGSYSAVALPNENVGINTWVRIYKVFTATADTVSLCIGRSGGGSNGTYWFTGVKLEEGDRPNGWVPSQEDMDKLFDSVVSPDGSIKGLDIASSLSVTPGAIELISQNIDLSGRVTFKDFAQGWALDENGNKISNADYPDYDPENPLYMDLDGNFRPLDDEKYFMNNMYLLDPETQTTLIDGNFIKTGTIQAKYADFMDVEVYSETGERTFSIDSGGNLTTVGTSMSAGYEPGARGWKIDNDGTAEFNSAVFRGDIELGYYDEDSGTFKQTGGVQSGAETGGKALRFWAGSDKSSAPFKVYSDGSLYATEGYFNGTFSGIVQVGNIKISDDADVKGDAAIVITNDLKVDKVVISESRAEFNVDTAFGNFMNVNLNKQSLEFGDGTFRIDYPNNLIQMKNFSIQGNESLEFISAGSSNYDFVMTNKKGDANMFVDGSMTVRDTVDFENAVVIKRSLDSGNKGIDFLLI
ncbi:carbohydrate binding domain-containing protein [Cytobacillus horneckiae]|uniref:phage head spike fiber domain-containing protein n=1 Tax=Cytobacillus horneckiae TaxID=549687 RepID=UPI0034CE563E